MEDFVARRRTSTLISHLRGNLDSEVALDASFCAASVPKLEVKTLEDERARCDFDVRKLTYLIDGSEKRTLLKESIFLLLERDAIMNEGLKRYDLSREEARVLSTKKFFRIGELLKGKDEEYIVAFSEVLDMFDSSVGMRWFVQNGLWIGTITAQGTDEQQKKWLDGALEMKIIGCFGMTELGNSSFLRGAETVATFDEKTDEFVIHSTSITATKWWIGLAGQVATHCIIFANLVCKGKPCGIQLFIVPLRNPKTGDPYPGVSLGDLGAKYGRNGLDNGWIQLTQVRVPRENMLAKWAQVSRNGEFTPPPNPALAYGSTITERVGSVLGTSLHVDQALTIAVRYSAIRRQGPGNPQILNFSSQQDRLMPLLAGAYATHFTFLRISKVYKTMLSDLRNGDTDGFLRPLADVHNTSCGLKAILTWWGTEALETCRRSVGGHGYSQYSGIPRLISDFGVMTTGGGDNIVIAQQTARYLLKAYQSALSGKQREGESISYIFSGVGADVLSNKRFHATTVDDLLNISLLKDAFEYVALRLLRDGAEGVQSGLSGGKKMADVWNENMGRMLEATRAHIHLYVLTSFIHSIHDVSDAPLKSILTKLCQLFALRVVQQNIGDFVEDGYMSQDHIPLVKKAVARLCKEIRPVAVSLVDAFNIPDFILCAPLGSKDGDIYEKYLDAVKNSRNGNQVAPYWNELVKPRVENQSQSASQN